MSAWQRVSAARSTSSFLVGGVYAVVAFFVTWMALICLAVLVGPTLPAEVNPFVEIMQSLNNLPVPLAFVLAIMIFPGLAAAMLSTADTFLNAAGHTFSLDLLSVDVNSSAHGKRPHVQVHVFVLGAIGLTLALILRSIGFGIVELVFAVYGGTLSLFAPVVLSIFLKNKKILSSFCKPALIAIVLGLIAAWLNGFYSTLARNAPGNFWETLRGIIPIDVYRSPTYAILVSTIVFVFFCAIISLWNIFLKKQRHGQEEI